MDDGSSDAPARPFRKPDSVFKTRAAAVMPSGEDRFRIISNTVLDAILMMDDKGHVVFWNPAAERIFGYTEKEILGKNLHGTLVPEGYHEAFDTGHREFMQSGQGNAIGQVLELTAIRKDGTEFPVELALSPMQVEERWWAVGIIRDITQRKAIVGKLKVLAVTDGLTNLYNRRYLMNRLRQEFDRAARYGRDLCLLMIDVDHFKVVNDEHGHDAGDRVLQHLASLFVKSVRRTDVVARFGGEEFVAVLPETDRSDSELLAERIRETVAATSFEMNGAHHGITVSIGGATRVEGIDDPETLLKMADTALYAAKQDGRNKVNWS